MKNAAALSVQSQSNAQPVVAGVIEISVGIARVRIEGTPDVATLRVVLRTDHVHTELDLCHDGSAIRKHSCVNDRIAATADERTRACVGKRPSHRNRETRSIV